MFENINFIHKMLNGHTELNNENMYTFFNQITTNKSHLLYLFANIKYMSKNEILDNCKYILLNPSLTPDIIIENNISAINVVNSDIESKFKGGYLYKDRLCYIDMFYDYTIGDWNSIKTLKLYYDNNYFNDCCIEEKKQKINKIRNDITDKIKELNLLYDNLNNLLIN